jgi:hypothetical protein
LARARDFEAFSEARGADYSGPQSRVEERAGLADESARFATDLCPPVVRRRGLRALIMHKLNHNNLAYTKRNLGITDDELEAVVRRLNL